MVILIDTCYTPSIPLEDDKQYYWKVKATDTRGRSRINVGFPNSFITNTSNDNPLPCQLNSPINDTIINAGTARLSWKIDEDPDIGDVPIYELHYANNMTFNNERILPYIYHQRTNINLPDSVLGEVFWKVVAHSYKSDFTDGGTSVSSVSHFFIKGTYFLEPKSIDAGSPIVINSNDPYTIKWKCYDIDTLCLEYSIDGGGSWALISDIIPSSSDQYLWDPPNLSNNNCRLRLSDRSDNSFYSVSESFSLQIPDGTLPIQLSSFSIEKVSEGVLLKWVTESETDNMGFNIYRAISIHENIPPDSSFVKINRSLIPGNGSTSKKNEYQYIDRLTYFDKICWYKLEDICYNGMSRLTSAICTKIPRPETFYLSQNHPNPFNTNTVISYQLPNPSFVKFTVYDLRGRLVSTLVNERKNAGYYSVEWNSSNVASGIYFFRIEADDFTKVKKCLIVK